MRGSLTSSAHWKAFTAHSADKLLKLKEKAPKGAFLCAVNSAGTEWARCDFGVQNEGKIRADFAAEWDGYRSVGRLYTASHDTTKTIVNI